jgi:plasmid replication initiation protein
MAMQQLTLPGEVVKKRNELVRSKISISNVDGSRILANLIACVRHDDTQFKDTYRVPVKDFMSDTSGRGYSNIKAMCRELAKATAEIEEPDPDGPHPIFRIYTFFSSISYRKGVVEARFNQEMQPLLLDLRRCFTQYNLMEYLTLPSLYSQKLFEILKSWANAPEVVLSVAELHRILDTPPSFRADFKAFRVRVLEKAYKDIQEKTTLHFEWEPVKAGRSVEAIRFSFGPGRKAIAEAETAKAKAEKKRRLENRRFMAAIECAKAKKGECSTMDNKRLVCKLCVEKEFCDGIRRRGGKPFDPTGKNG